MWRKFIADSHAYPYAYRGSNKRCGHAHFRNRCVGLDADFRRDSRWND